MSTRHFVLAALLAGTSSTAFAQAGVQPESTPQRAVLKGIGETDVYVLTSEGTE